MTFRTDNVVPLVGGGFRRATRQPQPAKVIHLSSHLDRLFGDRLPAEDLTPEGVQLVIPGAEKVIPVSTKQLEFW